jgi:hypothetical protein
MSNYDDYLSLRAAMNGIKKVLVPNIPINILVAESGSLSKWVLPDKQLFLDAKRDWAIVESLEVKTAALQYAKPSGPTAEKIRHRPWCCTLRKRHGQST